jgi:MFS superfamily sulfate permease-like transporter
VSGLVAGVVGGIVVPFLSRSPLSVTGPAAGLTAVVLFETKALGSFERLLTATMIAGCLQMALGFARTGRFAALVPDSVIRGMLAAIGIIIVWKQLPALVGGDGAVSEMGSQFAAGAASIAAASLLVLYGWGATPLARHAFLPPALVVVAVSVALASAFAGSTTLALSPKQMVDVPLGGWSALRDALPVPDMGAFGDPLVWRVAVTVALVASIETLLSLKAIDGIDPLQRVSPPNQELVAQGAANLASGWLGGLPVTAVIVRSGANLQAGGRERLSALMHGVLLLLAVLFAGRVLNMIPLACLAAVLVQVGLKLASPKLLLEEWRLGWTRFVPFVGTIAGVLATDLLKGVVAGIALELAIRIAAGRRTLRGEDVGRGADPG